MLKRTLGMAILLGLTACSEAPTTGETATTAPAANTPEAVAPTGNRPAANPTMNAYFGDVHIHTRYSFDAYAFGVKATPDDAYRFAKGESIYHDGGYQMQLSGPPLDFLAVTDHGEYMGVVSAMDDPTHPLHQTEIAQAIYGETATDPQAAFVEIGTSFVLAQPIEEIYDQDYMNEVWANMIATAEEHYVPGEFTTFAAYEYTAMRPVMQVTAEGELAANGAANLHRNVIFRDEAPAQIYSSLESLNAEDLWDWMDGVRADGMDVLSIPHNSNSSNGEMFSTEMYYGESFDADYARQRILNEPLMEISQIKGTSETHPMLSPNDEWSNFELYEYFVGSSARATVNDGDFARQSLARGLAIEDEIGVNPYAFGFIGSSDTHVAAGSFDEDNHTGKFPTDGAGPEARSSVPPNGATEWEGEDDASGRLLHASQYSASGLAGVWAQENTRESIFDAMRRKETFGTSGTRMKVRFFAGNDYASDILSSANMLETAYADGVPMGGDLLVTGGADASPEFIAWAMRDPNGAALERVQIIKVWTDESGPQEAIYDVACAGGAAIDPATHRCDMTPARVDTSTCEVDNSNGNAELKAVWNDPDFDRTRDAAYYVRAIEIEACRWSTFDALRAGVAPNPALAETLQERAWSSPIWVKDGGE